jgi:hypothetical protein
MRRYVCPVDSDQILFVERLETQEMVVPERPVTCPTCRKSYYKHECVLRAEEVDP